MSIPLHELNKHLNADILPQTHALEAPAARKFSKQEVAACKAAGVDPAALSAEELAAVVAAANLGK